MNGLLIATLLAATNPCEGLPANYVADIDVRLATAKPSEAQIDDADALRQQLPDCAAAQLGYALVLNRDLQEASGLAALMRSRDYRATLDRALELDPGLLRARVERIEFLIHAPGIAGGDVAAARSAIAALRSEHPVPAARLALALERKAGNAIAQLAALERLVEVAPDDAAARIDLAQRLILADKFAEAERHLIELQPTLAAEDQKHALAIPFLRGRLRVRGGFELEVAVELLHEYLRLSDGVEIAGLPRRALALYRWAEALEASGRCAEAASAYAQVLLVDSAIEGLAAAAARTEQCDVHQSPSVGAEP